MANKYNFQYFSKEQVEAGRLNDLLKVLMDMTYGDENRETKNEILLVPQDMGAWGLAWVSVPWDESYGGSFKYVDEDEEILIRRYFPDNTEGLFYDEEEYQTALGEWLKNHPTYQRTRYGTWYDSAESISWDSDLDGGSEDTEDDEDRIDFDADPNSEIGESESPEGTGAHN